MANALSDATIAYIAQRLNRVFAPFVLVPFNLLAGASDRARMGGGQLRVGLTVASGGSLVVAHDLARVPVGVQLLDNGTTAQTLLTVTARSTTSVTIVPSSAALSASSVLFIF